MTDPNPPFIERFFAGGWKQSIESEFFVRETNRNLIEASGRVVSKTSQYRTYYPTSAEARQAIIDVQTWRLTAAHRAVAEAVAHLARANAFPAERPSPLNTSNN